MQNRTKIVLSVFLLVQIAALRLLANYPQFVETYYSQAIYPYISTTFRLVFGWIPFSVGEMLYSTLIILLLRWLYLNLKKIKTHSKSLALTATANLSLIFFVFNMLWGLNYYRVPLHQTLQLEKTYTTQELITFTQDLIAKANHLHSQLATNDSLPVSNPYTHQQTFQIAAQAFKDPNPNYPFLQLKHKSLKTSTWSLPLSYMGIGGYYNPITAEAHVNKKIIKHRFAIISLHEIAHQLGYAAENEANFIAYLVATNHHNTYFQYAATLFALRYCLNQIAQRDPETFQELTPSIAPGILQTYTEIAQFWQKYQGPLNTLSNRFFDQFLKANNQPLGIQSYSYMVALLVNYHKTKPL